MLTKRTIILTSVLTALLLVIIATLVSWRTSPLTAQVDDRDLPFCENADGYSTTCKQAPLCDTRGTPDTNPNYKGRDHCEQERGVGSDCLFRSGGSNSTDYYYCSASDEERGINQNEDDGSTNNGSGGGSSEQNNEDDQECENEEDGEWECEEPEILLEDFAYRMHCKHTCSCWEADFIVTAVTGVEARYSCDGGWRGYSKGGASSSNSTATVLCSSQDISAYGNLHNALSGTGAGVAPDPRSSSSSSITSSSLSSFSSTSSSSMSSSSSRRALWPSVGVGTAQCEEGIADVPTDDPIYVPVLSSNSSSSISSSSSSRSSSSSHVALSSAQSSSSTSRSSSARSSSSAQVSYPPSSSPLIRSASSISSSLAVINPRLDLSGFSSSTVAASTTTEMPILSITSSASSASQSSSNIATLIISCITSLDCPSGYACVGKKCVTSNEVAALPAYCGNARVDPTEECDQGDANGTTGALCSSECTLNGHTAAESTPTTAGSVAEISFTPSATTTVATTSTLGRVDAHAGAPTSPSVPMTGPAAIAIMAAGAASGFAWMRRKR